jgi:gluconokinase
VPKRIIVSGGILRSVPEVRLLADAIGRDVEMARDGEASLRGAAVYALQHLGLTVPEPRRGKMVRHKAALAAKHRERRARQIELESLLRGHSR